MCVPKSLREKGKEEKQQSGWGRWWENTKKEEEWENKNNIGYCFWTTVCCHLQKVTALHNPWLISSTPQHVPYGMCAANARKHEQKVYSSWFVTEYWKKLKCLLTVEGINCGILNSHRNEWTTVVCNNMVAFLKHTADQRKPDGRKYIQHDPIHINFKVGEKRTDTFLGLHA